MLVSWNAKADLLYSKTMMQRSFSEIKVFKNHLKKELHVGY